MLMCSVALYCMVQPQTVLLCFLKTWLFNVGFDMFVVSLVVKTCKPAPIPVTSKQRALACFVMILNSCIIFNIAMLSYVDICFARYEKGASCYHFVQSILLSSLDTAATPKYKRCTVH